MTVSNPSSDPKAPKNQTILTQTILGSRRLSNYFWAVAISIGATGFVLASLSSYTQINFLPFADPTQLIFLPQGLVMGLYGMAGLLLVTYLWLAIAWDLGGGYNEFNKETQQVTIFRWGFPGKNRRIELTCPIENVQAVKVTLKEGLSPKRNLYLRVKGMRDLPLTRVGRPLALSDLENQAAELVRFLGVPLEGL
ncbi:MAG: photosystem I assembly protein Ycf4 [Synechococcales bacterium]|nr:photosystem I assembly protein Ycf4 [Synechococcales bacterium]